MTAQVSFIVAATGTFMLLAFIWATNRWIDVLLKFWFTLLTLAGLILLAYERGYISKL